LQIANKSTTIRVGICEDVHVQVAHHCMILTDFVVLEMLEHDNMSIILGIPFLNIAGAVIDCKQEKVTFNVDEKKHTVYFPKNIDGNYGLNSIINVDTIQIGKFHLLCPSQRNRMILS
jgi:hypothetical protein